MYVRELKHHHQLTHHKCNQQTTCMYRNLSIIISLHIISVINKQHEHDHDTVSAFISHTDWLIIAYIGLFSALLSRLTALACGSTWVTSFLQSSFCFCFQHPPKWLLKWWHGWCHMKLQLSRCKFCVHHTTILHVTSCKATQVGSMCV